MLDPNQAPLATTRRQALQGLAAVLLAQQAPAFAAPQRMLVGQSVPLTGANAEFGKAIASGAKAWFARHNARGGAWPIEHQVLDDGNDPVRSAANAQSLVAKGASALFGFASATLSLPALPVVRESGVPLFAPFTGAAAIHDLQDPLIFTARASYAQEADKFMVVLKLLGLKTVAVVHYADRVGKENRDVVVQAIQRSGQRAEPIVAIERNKPVPEDLMRSLAAQQADAVLFTVLAAPTAQIVQYVRAAGLKPLTHMIALSFVGPSQLAKLLGEQSRGIVVSHVVPRPWDSAEIVVEHTQAMRALAAPEPPSFASLESYIAAKALTLGLERSRSARPDALAAALEGVDADLGGYRLRFGKNARNGSSYVAYTIFGKDTVR
jgi:branched-chain amino acid transport system substrate-binding protein